MQQRRGTAAQWTSADPILAAAEIGFESDTGKFKIGDGINHWSTLSYYASADDIAGLIDGAPDLLNTLNELAAAIGDDADFVNTMASKTWTGTAIDNHSSTTTAVHGIADTSQLATQTDITNAVSTHNDDHTNIHGIADTSLLATKGEVADAELYADNAVADHNSATEGVHGIINTAVLATNNSVASDIATHNDETTNVHGIEDTSVLVTQTDLTNNISTHNSDTTDVHGISNTANLAYQTDIQDANQYADDAVSTHNLDTTSVHGIADTAALATKSYADGAVSTAVAGLTKSSVGLGNVDNTSDANKPVSTATQSALDLKAPIASPTFTGTVSGITKTMVGLANVDNTTDANKPVSTATQTALDLKAPKASPTFTGTVTAADLTVSGTLTVNGTTETVNSTTVTIADPMIYLGGDNSGNAVDLGIVSSFNDGTYQHSGIVRDASDGKWKLFKGVTDEPTTTVNFAQGSLDALAVGALEATTVTPSSGVVFSDGTQTKEGVASRTPIVQKTDSYTLSALTERDSLIEISKASAVTLTIPADSTLNFPIGTSLDILQTGAGQITVAGAGGVTVNATPGLKLRTQWSGATLFKRAANTWVVYGDLSA